MAPRLGGSSPPVWLKIATQSLVANKLPDHQVRPYLLFVRLRLPVLFARPWLTRPLALLTLTHSCVLVSNYQGGPAPGPGVYRRHVTTTPTLARVPETSR